MRRTLQPVLLSALIYRTVLADYLSRVMNNQPLTLEMQRALFQQLTTQYPQLVPIADLDAEFKRFGNAMAAVLTKLDKSNLTKVI